VTLAILKELKEIAIQFKKIKDENPHYSDYGIVYAG